MAPLLAAFHLIQLHAIFPGTAGTPRAQYVELRATAPGQTLVANRRIAQQAADGSPAPDFAVLGNAAFDAQAGASILVCTPEAEALFGLACDQLTEGALVQPDGRVCYDVFDCVAFGRFRGADAGFGSPAAALAPGLALTRRADTGDNAVDFANRAPAPRNNAGEQGALLAAPGEGADAGPDADGGTAVQTFVPAVTFSPDAGAEPAEAGPEPPPPEPPGCTCGGALIAGPLLLGLAAVRPRRRVG